VPFEKLCKAVIEDPFIPIAFQKEHSGMQGHEYFNEQEQEMLKHVYLDGKNKLVASARSLHFGIGITNGDSQTNIEVTKQLCNRWLEPFQWYTCIVTATEFENFFALRCPKYSLLYEQIPMEFRSKKDLLKFVRSVEAPEFKDSYNDLTPLEWLKCNKGMAEIHLMELAECMWDAYNEHQPEKLKEGEWHTPFFDRKKPDPRLMSYLFDKMGRERFEKDTINPVVQQEYAKEYQDTAIKIATARCARVSYTVVGEEGKPDDYRKDIELYDRLLKSGHMSPFEHCAKAMSGEEYKRNTRQYTDGKALLGSITEHGWSGNFRGFIQYRKTLPNEAIFGSVQSED
jgi:hypothetical protein